ncbi:MAG TPA: helix-turn-helix transcriptional regulator [Mycobacteriales bacterium]|nr:helix-turn-helix transcriptional regulator [Mycobacteriales bacterium]
MTAQLLVVRPAVPDNDHGEELVMVGGRRRGTWFDGARLRALRHQAKLSQRALGAAIGADEMMIASYENGRAVPRVDRLGRLALALGASPADLLPADHELDSLERLRVAAGMLQAEVAGQAGMTRTKYAAIERGQTATISRADAQELARILGVDVDEVLAAQAVARAAYLDRLPR